MRRLLIPLLAIFCLLFLFGCRGRDQYVEVISSHTDPLIRIPLDTSLTSTFSPFDPRFSAALQEQDLEDAKRIGVPLVVEVKAHRDKGVTAFDFWLTLLDEKGQEMELKLDANYFRRMRCVAVRYPQGSDAEARKWLRITDSSELHFADKASAELMFLLPSGLPAKRAKLKFLSSDLNQADARGTAGLELQVVGPFDLNHSKGWFD